MIIVGVDVGNATTEAALARIEEDGSCRFLRSVMVNTTGTKGTIENISGIRTVLDELTKGLDVKIDRILLNDAAPVIADYAMETITETVITDSAMIGHNPDTPGGEGLGTGETVRIGSTLEKEKPYLVVIPREVGFDEAAEWINEQCESGHIITGAIVQPDEGTLINNRLKKIIPIVDEVELIDEVPLGMPGAIEVAAPGYSVDTLSNPYGIATVFSLDSEETLYCKNIAKALIGNRSAVVIKTPASNVKTRVIPAGDITAVGERYSQNISVDSGAEEIMKMIDGIPKLVDVKGQSGTNIGGMLDNIRIRMAKSCEMRADEITLSDLLAIDSYAAVHVQGGIASEVAMENGVAIAAMVHMNNSFMQKVGAELQEQAGIPVEIGGVEGAMALTGVLTTPGVDSPCVMIDIGAGSTDAASIDENGERRVVHLAGAGNLITMLIQSELNLSSFREAELIKKYPIAHVNSLHKIKYESGEISFFDQPLDPKYYGQIVAVKREDELYIIDTKESIEKIRYVRRNAKRSVMTKNINRIIQKLQINKTLRQRLVLVGGSVHDFELANILTDEMDRHGVVVGKGNIRGIEGPRNAVATGLVLDYVRRQNDR